MSSSLELRMQTIICYDFLLPFRSDELCVHLAILGLAEASVGGEIQGEMVSIRQTFPKGHISAGLLLESCSKQVLREQVWQEEDKSPN